MIRQIGVFGALLFFPVAYVGAQTPTNSNDPNSLIAQGKEALDHNQLREAAEAFQKAIDLNPSSVRAHEFLGVTLSKLIISGGVSPSTDSDISERAESNLKRAIELAPSSTAPLLELSELEAALAQRATDANEQAEHYRLAQDSLRQVFTLEPGKPDMYLRLAMLQRDEFGPAIDQAKSRFPKSAGPIPDSEVRRELKQRFGAMIDDAITNAQTALQSEANPTRPLLLISRMLRQRALIRDTKEDYISDMNSANDFQREFLTAGGHLDGEDGHR